MDRYSAASIVEQSAIVKVIFFAIGRLPTRIGECGGYCCVKNDFDCCVKDDLYSTFFSSI